MRIIVGLGNPSSKYISTRHNIGFLMLDRIIRSAGVRTPALTHKLVKAGALTGTVQNDDINNFRLEKKFEAEVAKFKRDGQDILLVKPQTFMNESGRAVKKIVDFYKVNPAKDLIVIYDDMDIGLGEIRIKNTGSSAGHKGLQSIIDNLGKEGFLRVRIGIGRPSGGIKPEDYVLEVLSNDEMAVLAGSIDDFLKKEQF